MLALEAALTLFFWVQWTGLVHVQPVPLYCIRAAWAAEEVWHSPESAWTDPVEKGRLESFWSTKTGCCVAFSKKAWQDCLFPTRVAYPKTVWQEDGLGTVFAVASCPAS
ncbi:hypothetical protein HY572_01685 [Candidatus Micrarchaeota archaeon]|nr:hypothetical protein [Candidatus Micrarchaeota archaeon]